MVHKRPEFVIIDVGGVGYQVFVPPGHFEHLPPLSQEISLFTSLTIREDTLELYGFLDLEQRDLFLLIQHTSGIGPRTALNIVSDLSPQDLARAVLDNDIGLLSRIPGVGRKTAERLCVELKDRLKTRMTSPSSNLFGEALSALVNLGFKRSEVEEVLGRILLKDPKNLEEVIREALKALSHE
ncbi:Holliday junction branch migration protein RuvA [Thermosulfuriphilus sp.]